MKRLLSILTIIFGILTFIGAGYVIYMKGEVNAGYAVAPMCMMTICSTFNKKDKNKNE